MEFHNIWTGGKMRDFLYKKFVIQPKRYRQICTQPMNAMHTAYECKRVKRYRAEGNFDAILG
jgi:hypothetical protein